MGVYTRPLNMTQNKIISFEEFVDYFQESDYQIRMMFEKEELVYSIQEANDSELQLPSIVRNVEFTAGEPEKVKKTLVEWVKETFSNFIKAIKDLFDKVSKTVYDFYMRTNFIDDIVSKFKDKVTYPNLQTAQSKGWKGLSIEKGESVINRLVDTNVSTLKNDKDWSDEGIADDEFFKEDDFEAIIKAQDLNDAKEEYRKIKEKLEKFKSRKERENKFAYEIRMNKGADENTIYTGFFGNYTDKDHKYYFPAPKQFTLTKKFAETGQSEIKKIREVHKFLTKGLEDQKSVLLNNMNSYKKDGSNNIDDKETNQINILYYKAQYEYSSAYISRTKRVVNTLISLIKDQHRIAIRTYTVMAMAVNKYVTA